MRPKCRTVYEMVRRCTWKEIFGLFRRSSLIAVRETPQHLGHSITESHNRHTGLLPGPLDSTTTQWRREICAKFRIQVKARKTLRKWLAFSAQPTSSRRNICRSFHASLPRKSTVKVPVSRRGSSHLETFAVSERATEASLLPRSGWNSVLYI